MFMDFNQMVLISMVLTLAQLEKACTESRKHIASLEGETAR